MSNEDSAQDCAQGSSSTKDDGCLLMTRENNLEVVELYKSNPRLWADFRKIIDFMDFFQQHPRAYGQLLDLLDEINFGANVNNAAELLDMKQRIQFMVAVGFVDKIAEMYLQLREEMGNTSMTKIHMPHPSIEMKCFHNLTLHFLSGTDCSDHFGLCLLHSGVLQIILNDVKHMQNTSSTDLEDGLLYEYSVSILHNSCIHPEVLPTLRELGAVDCMKPFLAKSLPLVRVLALMTLARLVNDSERKLLRLDSDVFRFFCDKVEEVLAAEPDAVLGWELDQILFTLSACAQLESNRKMLSTNGFLYLLALILQIREKEEQLLALAIARELGKSSESLQDLARVRPLWTALDDLKCSADQTMAQDAASILSLLPAEGEDHLLVDKMHLLTVMGIGEVEFEINQLKELCAEGGGENGDGDVTRLTVLQAMTELAQKSDTAKEIVEKGGLEVLSRCLQQHDAEAEVKRQTLLVLQQLSCHRDCCDSLKMLTIPGLVQTLRELRESSGGGISDLAADILKTNTIPLE